jgi:hypothetical protein
VAGWSIERTKWVLLGAAAGCWLGAALGFAVPDAIPKDWLRLMFGPGPRSYFAFLWSGAIHGLIIGFISTKRLTAEDQLFFHFRITSSPS